MEQVTFADVEYEGKKRRTRRSCFWERMEALIPWERLEARIRPLYPKGGPGRRSGHAGWRQDTWLSRHDSAGVFKVWRKTWRV